MKDDVNNLYCKMCGKIWIDPELNDDDCKCHVNFTLSNQLTQVPEGAAFIHHEKKV
jgi:hypothetical protein